MNKDNIEGGGGKHTRKKKQRRRTQRRRKNRSVKYNNKVKRIRKIIKKKRN